LNKKILKLEQELNITERWNLLDEKFGQNLNKHCTNKITNSIDTLKTLMCSYHLIQSQLYKQGFIGNYDASHSGLF
jgi:hypothetical protein